MFVSQSTTTTSTTGPQSERQRPAYARASATVIGPVTRETRGSTGIRREFNGTYHDQ